MRNDLKDIRRGQVVRINLGKNKGSVQSGIKNAVVVQNDVGNKYSTTIIIAPISFNSSKIVKTHSFLKKDNYEFLNDDCKILTEQLIVVSKSQVIEVLGFLNNADMMDVTEKIIISLDINKEYNKLIIDAEAIYSRGKVIIADLGNNIGSVQSGIRPVLIIQNNVGNYYSPNLIVIPFTSSLSKKKIPTHFNLLKNKYNFLTDDSLLLGEQVFTISKEQVKKVLGSVDELDMKEIDKKMIISLTLNQTLVNGKLTA